MPEVETILNFWFGEPDGDPHQNSKLWWQKNEDFDREIKEKFEDLLIKVKNGEREKWLQEPRSSLAYIIMLDQFSRNMYRNTPQSFSQDQQALEATLNGLDKEFDQKLNLVERVFFYMPLMHAEDLNIQRKSVEVFQKLVEAAPPAEKEKYQGNHKFAIKHMEIIERFGRYPHRNKILGRQSSNAETDFLKQPGSSF